MTARNEVAAELALEPRSRNSQPGLFLTPEPQWDARGLGSPRPVSCQPAPEPLLWRLLKDAARHSQQHSRPPGTAALEPKSWGARFPLIGARTSGRARGRLGNEVPDLGVPSSRASRRCPPARSSAGVSSPTPRYRGPGKLSRVGPVPHPQPHDSVEAEMFRPRRSLWPGAGRPQGGARGEREALAGSRSPGTGRGDAGKAWREASPGKRGPKHGGRVGHRAGRESRGQPCSTAQDEPTSAIYFRNLKPVSGSQGDIPMTTDVGPLR